MINPTKFNIIYTIGGKGKYQFGCSEQDEEDCDTETADSESCDNDSETSLDVLATEPAFQRNVTCLVPPASTSNST